MPLYYISKDGQQSGPFDEERIESGLKTESLKPGDLCWCEGMEKWQAIREVFEVSSPQNEEVPQIQSPSQTEESRQNSKSEFVEKIRDCAHITVYICGFIIASKWFGEPFEYSDVLFYPAISIGIIAFIIDCSIPPGDEM